MSTLRNAARDKSCKVRVPGVCTFDTAKTVSAHLNGAGMGIKHHDLFAADACDACHKWLDGGYVKDTPRRERDRIHLEAVVRTIQARIDEGLVKTAGEQ